MPMLARIAENSHHVVTPVIETIDEEKFTVRLTSSKDIQVGKFDWGLTFNWMPVPASIRKNLTSVTMPIRLVFMNAFGGLIHTHEYCTCIRWHITIYTCLWE